MPQLDVKNLTLAYENLTVTKDLSFSVNAGDYLLIVGENGTGKSTLVKAILGLKAVKSGDITFGCDLNQTEIGYLPQRTNEKNDFPATVYDVVVSGAMGADKLFVTKKIKEKAYEKMELLGITELAKRSFGELSGGQRQRTLLARALLATKKLILLDEPTSALDRNTANELYRLIDKINKEENITIIMVSHDTRAFDYATHILEMGDTNIFTTKEAYLRRSRSDA